MPVGIVLGDRYLLQQHVAGTLSMGDTYLAVDLRRDRHPCLLRQLPTALQSDHLHRKIQAKILWEWRRLNTIPQLRPHLVRSLLHSGKRAFLVQDAPPLQDSTSLGQLVRSSQMPWSEQQVIRLFSHVLPFLLMLHRHRVPYQSLELDSIRLPSSMLPFYCEPNPSMEVGSSIPLALDLGYGPRWLTGVRGRVQDDIYHLALTGLMLLSSHPVTRTDLATLAAQQEVLQGLGDRTRSLLGAMLSLKVTSVLEVQQQVRSLLEQGYPVLLPLTRCPSQGTLPNRPVRTALGGELLHQHCPQLRTIQHHRGFLTLLPRPMRGYLTPLSISAALLVGMARVLHHGSSTSPDTTVWISGMPVPQSEVSTILAYTQPDEELYDSPQSPTPVER